VVVPLVPVSSIYISSRTGKACSKDLPRTWPLAARHHLVRFQDSGQVAAIGGAEVERAAHDSRIERNNQRVALVDGIAVRQQHALFDAGDTEQARSRIGRAIDELALVLDPCAIGGHLGSVLGLGVADCVTVDCAAGDGVQGRAQQVGLGEHDACQGRVGEVEIGRPLRPCFVAVVDGQLARRLIDEGHWKNLPIV